MYTFIEPYRNIPGQKGMSGEEDADVSSNEKLNSKIGTFCLQFVCLTYE
jgi:hypothetical protein